MIRNPILPGFNPDPSICRVGDDYYIATSTFEWYPGVQIFHSRDLANWELVARPLDRADLLDMRGNPDSGGIWAPCLSYADGRFWLVYTDVKRLSGSFKDAHNYITTAPSIDGPWSDRINVNSSGFDPSLFHDDDGRKWFSNVKWNHRSTGSGINPAHDRFDGILLQEWDEENGLTGPVKTIYAGTNLGLTEAPHIFKRNGYYYLTTAEGGTGYEHAVTLARSTDIWGPYDTHPDAHVITAKNAPDHPIQRTGHGQYVETRQGEAFHTFLMGRPLAGRVCPMGRETGIERCVWGDDDWLYLQDGGTLARTEFEHAGADGPPTSSVSQYDFTQNSLHKDFQWLRTPYPDRLFRLEQGKLVLIGRESIGSHFEQSLVARRREHNTYCVETLLTGYDPETYQQAAGLTAYYNSHKYLAAVVTHEQGLGRVISVLACQGDATEMETTFPVMPPVQVPNGDIHLRLDVQLSEHQFYWSVDAMNWNALGQEPLSAAYLSDEGGLGEHGSFTGTFVGMLAFDVSGAGKEAEFTTFSYAGHD